MSPSIEKTPSVLFQSLFERCRVAVLITDDRRSGQPAPVDDRRVVQLIGKNQVVFPDQRRDRGDIRVEARLKRDRRFNPLESCELVFKLRVQSRGPGNGTHGRRSDPEPIDCLLRRLPQPRVIGEPEIIVRAEVQHLFPIHRDPRPLGRLDRPHAHQ